jgi:hypothetical protein
MISFEPDYCNDPIQDIYYRYNANNGKITVRYETIAPQLTAKSRVGQKVNTAPTPD